MLPNGSGQRGQEHRSDSRYDACPLFINTVCAKSIKPIACPYAMASQLPLKILWSNRKFVLAVSTFVESSYLCRAAILMNGSFYVGLVTKYVLHESSKQHFYNLTQIVYFNIPSVSYFYYISFDITKISRRYTVVRNTVFLWHLFALFICL
jgi:hypothetical protein